MKGNFHVPFLGELGAAMPPAYPTNHAMEILHNRPRFLRLKSRTWHRSADQLRTYQNILHEQNTRFEDVPTLVFIRKLRVGL